MASDEIPLMPSIPARLRLAARQGIIVPFVGAGVSQLCGCPGWDAFAAAALRSFLKPGMLDHAQFDQLSRLPPRLKVSVAVGFERQFSQTIDFVEILSVREPALRKLGDQIYGHLGALARTFITTNYDDWLDTRTAAMPTGLGVGLSTASALPPVTGRNCFFLPGEFTSRALSEPDNVFHIHGSASNRDSMLLTTSHYLERYASHRLSGRRLIENSYLEFLGHLFRTKSVLFVGYGLDELEILEFVIQKAVGLGQDEVVRAGVIEEPQHHIIQGFFSHELPVMRSLQEYYLREFNVRLLPFSRDEKGWHQLIDVLEYLAREIPVHGILPAQQRHELEELLK